MIEHLISFAEELDVIKKTIKEDRIFSLNGFDYTKPLINFIDNNWHVKPQIEKKVNQIFVKHQDVLKDIESIKKGILLKFAIMPTRLSFEKSFDNDKWLKEICPFCGGKPTIGFITSEGQRFLQCVNCDTKWRFRRAQCPFCLEESGEYFPFQLDEINLRAEVCNNCMAYIKSFLGEMEEDSSFLLDTKTLVIDKEMQERGYKKETLSVLGINFKFE